MGSVDGGEPAHWRDVALSVPPIKGTADQVEVAMPTTEIDATIARVERILLGTSVAVLVALGALTRLLIRIGLRPLRRMEQSAEDAHVGRAPLAPGPVSTAVAPGAVGFRASRVSQVHRAAARYQTGQGGFVHLGRGGDGACGPNPRRIDGGRAGFRARQ